MPLKASLGRLTPATLTSLIAAVLTVATAFGAPLTAAQEHSVLVLGGSVSLTFLAHGLSGAFSNLAPQSVVGLVTAVIGVACAFGLPITHAQTEAVLGLSSLLAVVLLGGGAFHTMRRESQPKNLLVHVHGSPERAEVPKRKTGRLPGVWPEGLKEIGAYATKILKPPAVFAAPRGSYPMDGNDKYGDCTLAGVAHFLAAWNKLFGHALKVPGAKTIIQTYFKLTSGQDTGLVEADVLRTWQTKGLFGTKIAAYAPIHVKKAGKLNKADLKRAIAFYGGAYLGILCPDSAQREFGEGKPWTDCGEEAVDGHCIVGLGYTKDGLLCGTWGQVVLVTWGFLDRYLEEGWCILSKQLVDAGKDTLGINVAALQADLPSV